MDNVYLQGSEAVANAGRAIAGAADDMQRAARNLDGSLDMALRRLEECIGRFEAAAEKIIAALEKGT